MADSNIERQAIRAALALAVASAHAQVADAIVDLRDEATQLIGLCINENGSPDVVRQWCDGSSALIERLSSDGYLPRRPALSAAAAILRLRLAVAQKTVQSTRAPEAHARPAKKKIVRSVTAPMPSVEGKQKVVVEFIAGHPDIRTKNLIDALGATLSPRTIKRCLKELSSAGVLKRTKLDDRSVVYRVDSQS
jgi:DNA-binding HxlR family transcriptional regulator